MASENNKRIAKNTMFLYFRQILILLVSLYTVRVVLDVLGVEDYGIYSVVAGVVALFSFLSGSMSSATQRFFSFALGTNDSEKLEKTFSANILIYVSIAIIALILLETVGLWFIQQELKIPPDRYEAALWVYHFSVFSFVTTIFMTPFMAIIIAHEDMHLHAFISIFEAILKLTIVFLLVYIPFDKLQVYGTLFFISSLITTSIYIRVCLKKYSECQFKKFFLDKKIIHEIVGFTGWTLFGQLTSVLRAQAVTILLNQFFTPVVVAARAIATNIASRINLFSENFNLGLYPPIIKSYATNDKERMFSLIFNGSKITFFLMWVFALPFILEMETILNVWLKNPPKSAVLFTQLAMIEVLINSISLPITTAARAPGKMRMYELILGSLQILIFFIAWLVLHLGNEAYTVYIVAITVNLLMFFVRLIIVKSLIELPLVLYFKRVVLPVLLIITISTLSTLLLQLNLPNGILYSILIVFLCVVVSSICMYYIGLNKEWRDKVKNIISNKFYFFYNKLKN